MTTGKVTSIRGLKECSACSNNSHSMVEAVAVLPTPEACTRRIKRARESCVQSVSKRRTSKKSR
jgi:hypothetical protein